MNTYLKLKNALFTTENLRCSRKNDEMENGVTEFTHPREREGKMRKKLTMF